MKIKVITDYTQLPIIMTAMNLAEALGISRSGAYVLMKTDGFPTLVVGGRLLVPKDDFLDWVKIHTKTIHGENLTIVE